MEDSRASGREEFPDQLLSALLAERGEERALPPSLEGKRRLLRALMSTRPPGPLAPGLLAMQDAELARQAREKGLVDAACLPPCESDPRLRLWQGDIVRLKVDAIVNAANSALLGCFSPLHACIDNAIHSAAGMELRNACAALMARQGAPEPPGGAKITPAFTLPCRHVLHTVGPIVEGDGPSPEDERLLASCYESCLDLAAQNGLESVAFCCVSTGVFGYPNEDAAKVAISTAKGWLYAHPAASVKAVIFNVFTGNNLEIYQRLLGGAGRG